MTNLQLLLEVMTTHEGLSVLMVTLVIGIGIGLVYGENNAKNNQ